MHELNIIYSKLNYSTIFYLKLIIYTISIFINITIELSKGAFMNYRLLITSCALSNFAGQLISHVALSPDLYSATGVTLCPRYLCLQPRMQRARKACKLSHMARHGPETMGQTRKPLQRQETRRPTLETRRGWCRLARAFPRPRSTYTFINIPAQLCAAWARIFTRGMYQRLCVWRVPRNTLTYLTLLDLSTFRDIQRFTDGSHITGCTHDSLNLAFILNYDILLFIIRFNVVYSCCEIFRILYKCGKSRIKNMHINFFMHN